MSPNSEIPRVTEPYIWTPSRYARVERLHFGIAGQVPHFRTLCWYCGLPAVQLKLAKKGRTWCAHCTRCGAMTFAMLPTALYAPTQLMWGPHDRGIDKLGTFVAGLVGTGSHQLNATRWVTVSHGKRSRVELDASHACLGCGEEASVSIRKDKHGLPYSICSACRNRTFLRNQYSLCGLMGWTSWLREGNADEWERAWDAGRVKWKSWLGLQRLDENEAAEASAEDARQREAR
jgi:transcription elongation factor Elf1